MNSVQKNQRQSGLELLKIMALFIIVISHITKTVTETPTELHNLQTNFYIIDNLPHVSDMYSFFMFLFRSFGQIGNMLFFICSAWFLCDTNKIKVNKVISMIINVWVISMIFLFVYLLSPYSISQNNIIRSILPFFYENNWYINLYIFIYITHFIYNVVLDNLQIRQLRLLLIVFFVIWFVIGFIKPGYLYENKIVDYIYIYLLVGYLKKYSNIISNKKCCIYTMCFSTLFLFILFLIFPLNQILLSNNPIILLLCISVFGLFRMINFNNNIINSMSSLSLFFYCIHENLLFRTYTRVNLLSKYFCSTTSLIYLFYILLFSVILFVFAYILSFVYYHLLGKHINNISQKLMKRYNV